jgi:hypothetical protein
MIKHNLSSRGRISQMILSMVYPTNVLGTKTLYASFAKAHCKIHLKLK